MILSKARRKISAQAIDFAAAGVHNPDDAQALVLEKLGENLVINAGAGSGKTGTLSLAIVEALINFETDAGDIGPSNILAITYTKAAAEELKERVADLLTALGKPQLAAAMEDSWISTIHAFCQKVLEKYAGEASYLLERDLPLEIIEEEEAQEIQDTVLDELISSFAHNHREAYLQLIGSRESRLKESIKDSIKGETLFYPQNIEKPAPGSQDSDLGLSHRKRTIELLKHFEQLVESYKKGYEDKKRELGKVDFYDLIQELQKLLDARPGIREELRSQFAIIFVDEFQDTNHLQFDIISNIAQDNLILVGDKRQSIYAFQGADVSVFERALDASRGTSPRATELKLANNYRSNPRILSSVNKIFSHDLFFGEDFINLEAKAPESSVLPADEPRVHINCYEVKHWNSSPNRESARWIVAELVRLYEEGLFDLDEMCVLVKDRSQARYFVQEFMAHMIDTVVLGDRNLYKDPLVQSLIGFANCLVNPYDNQQFVGAAISEYGLVEDEALVAVRRSFEAAKDKEENYEPGSLYQVATELLRLNGRQVKPDSSREAQQLAERLAAVPRPNIQEHALQSLELFISRIDEARALIGHTSPSDIYRYIIGSSGADLMLAHYDERVQIHYSTEQSLSNLHSVLLEVEAREQAGQSFAEITRLLRHASIQGVDAKRSPGLAREHIDDLQGSPKAITINTIHGSKGLEYPVVAVALPHMAPRAGTAIQTHFMPSVADPSRRVRSFSINLKLTDEEKNEIEQQIEAGIIQKDDVSAKEKKGEYPYNEAFRNRENTLIRDEFLRLAYVALTRARELLYVSIPHFDTKPGADTRNLRFAQRFIKILQDFEGDNALDGLAKVSWIPREKEGAAPEVQPLGESSLSYQPRENIDLLQSSFVDLKSVEQKRSSRWIEQLSASDINQFQDCPRQYWYRSVLRLGELKKIATDSASNRGQALHKVLELVSDGSIVYTDDLSFEDIKHVILRYMSDEEAAREVFELARKVINNERLKELGFWTSDERHAELQFYQGFTDLEGHECYLHGYIDALAQLDDEVLIIDYKTGYQSERKEERFKAQADSYAYYALSRGASKVRVLFIFVDSLDADKAAPAEAGAFDQAVGEKTIVPGAVIEQTTTENLLESTIEYEFFAAEKDQVLQTLIEHKRKLESPGIYSLERMREEGFSPSCYRCGFQPMLCKGLLLEA